MRSSVVPSATNFRLLFLLLTALLAGLMLCETAPLAARSATGAPPKDARIHLTVQIEHRFGNASFTLDEVKFPNPGGSLLSVTRLSYLISNVALLRADGSRVTLPGQVAWIEAEANRTSFDLTDVPPGKYAGIAFQIGLSPQMNHADPSVYPAGHPLNPVVDRLHWGWQGGYVFFAIEGRYEQPGDRLGGYSYHLATDADPMRVALNSPWTAAPHRALVLRCDMGRVFDGVYRVPVRAEDGGDSTHSPPGDPLAAHLKANVAHAFSLTGTAAQDRNAATAAPQGERMIVEPPHGTTPYTLPIPARFPQPSLPLDNPLTVEGIALGKRLFADPRLSGNDRQSCASCHRESAAFSDGGVALSRGADGQTGTRNALPLFNLAWSAGAYTWDGRRTLLRDQVLSPIQDAREMHQTLAATVRKIAAEPTYRAAFTCAFGSPGVTGERLSLAIEQYLLTIVSADSKFDRALDGRATFTDEEKQGLALFLTEYNPARNQFGADCFHCHGGNLFTDYRYKNNGLTFAKLAQSNAFDRGRADVTGRDADIGKFKTPTLRNVELTAPYMHDGRFQTLEEVVEHYNSGVHRSETLDPNLAKHPDDGLRLSASDKKALVAFLKTLTDERFREMKR